MERTKKFEIPMEDAELIERLLRQEHYRKEQDL